MSDQPSDRHPVLFAFNAGCVIACAGLALWYHSVWLALLGVFIFSGTAVLAIVLDTIHRNRNRSV